MNTDVRFPSEPRMPCDRVDWQGIIDDRFGNIILTHRLPGMDPVPRSGAGLIRPNLIIRTFR